MIKTESTKINGKEYTVTLFPAIKSYLLARKLISIFTAPDGNYFDKLCEIDESGELLLELLSQTVVDSTAITKATFNNLYIGSLSEALLAAIFVIKVNFPDFLGVGGKVEEITQQIQMLFPEQKIEPIVS